MNDQLTSSRTDLDLTSGSITKNIFKLAWPVMGSMLIETLRTIANAFWVGKLGAVALAAIISSAFLIWIIYSFISTISVGVVAMVSRFVGAKDKEKATYVSRQAYLFSIFSSLILMIAGITLTPFVFGLMGTEADVTQIGIGYLRIIFLGSISFFLIDVFSSIFRASGDTKRPLWVTLFSLSFNIILDPFLIFGWGPFPRLETNGAAIATVISQSLGVFIFFYLIKKGKLIFRFSLKPAFNIDLSIIRRIIRIGIPLSISGIVFSIVYLFINRIVAYFGTESIAALGIGNRMESLSYLSCFGFSIAAATLVGQNLGAGKPERAGRSAWSTVYIVTFITGIIAIMFLSFPKAISSFFITDPVVIPIAVNYLKILALSQIFMAWEIVLEGAFSGAGDTLPPMIVSLPGSVLRIPIAYLLAITLGLGVNGVWWAISLTSIAKGTVLVFWFRQGKWKKRQI
jgi:putative MATE family efflux protein